VEEQLTYEQANLVQRAMRRFAASGPGSWLFVRVLHRIDRPVYRLTGSRHTLANLVSGIPVVMLTSSREERDLAESYKLGVNAYVVKPIDFSEFLHSVKQLGIFWAIVNENPPVAMPGEG